MAREIGRRILLGTALAAPALWAAKAQVADPQRITALLQQQVDADEMLGVVAAVTGSSGQQIATAGRSGNDRALDGDSVFEIGSITKVFTALLLVEMVRRGEVALTDPVAQFLPPEGRPRDYDAKPMTLLDLATYTSGLPRMPGNFHPKDPANPYADYTLAQMYAFLSTERPLHYPGSFYEYSNLGFAVLGHALALRAGRPYEDLLVSRICGPLGLDSTRIMLTPQMQAPVAPGHDTMLNPTPGWDLPTFLGAGALHSTTNDMLRLVECCLGRQPSPIAPWLAATLDVRRQTDSRDTAAGLGWFVQTAQRDEIVAKNGDTGGYSTFIGYSTRTGAGVAVLSNTSNTTAVLQLGRYLLNPRFPNPTPRKPFPVDPATLAALAGRYEVTPGFVLTVRAEGGILMVQATNQDAYPVFAESNTRFHFKIVNAQLIFELSPDGQATAVTLHQNGRDMRGERQKL